jgi:UDP-N-acetyl-D-mannosaminuronic acid dehydrogenase
VARLLANAQASVKAFEPYKADARIPGIQIEPTLEAVLENVELVVLLVNHTELRDLDPQRTATLTTARLLVDAVGAWSVDAWKSAGFQLFRLGASTARPLS